MAIGIEIRFTGLCTFGPEQDDGKKFRSVMMVNARDDAKPGNPKMQPHLAALLVPYANLTGTGRDYDIRFDGRKAGFGPGSDDMVGFLLKGEQLSLPGLQGAGVSLEPGPLATADCPETGDRYGFGWVSSLKKAEGAKPTDEALVGKDKKKLLARLRIDLGRLATEKFVEHEGEIVKWKDLSSANPAMERALAEVVKLTGISVSGDQWVIHSEPFSGASVDIHLKGDGDRKAHVWFVNMPLEDIVGTDRTPTDAPQADEHFHHYYHLADRGSRNPKPGSGKCPPVASVAGEAHQHKTSPAPQVAHDSEPGAAASNPKCPPTSFEV